jgi:prepilin-type N-terminal cleavage/methylation domain-containing protein
MRKRNALKSQRGFTFLEVLISTAVMLIILAALFGQVYDSQRISTGEQVKLDLFQEAREFMDQMARDLRSTGYPNTLNFSSVQSPDSPTNAVGLLYADSGDLIFEASPSGDGTVYDITYHLDTSTTNGCPCLKRSSQVKQSGAGSNVLAQAQNNVNYETEVQNILVGDPVFTPYKMDATLPLLPVDLINNALVIADINTIAVKLTVQSPRADPRTGTKPTITLMQTVKLSNCSNAYGSSGASFMGCH